ncbi:MAG: YtxH domain-containing protein [Finegoldia sp.]|nr:YtxH domain-containing protein [Finegoldia sp.]
MNFLDYLALMGKKKQLELEWEYAKTKHRDEIRLAGAALVGAAAGLTAGLLFAPKSGEETRKDLKDLAEQTKKDAQLAVEEAQETVVKGYHDFRGKGMTELGKVSDNLEDVKETVSDFGSNLKEAALNEKDIIKDSLEYAKLASKENLDEFSDSAKEDLEEGKEIAEDVKAAADDVKEDVKATVEDVKKDVEKGAKEVKDDVKKASKYDKGDSTIIDRAKKKNK